MCGRYAIAPTRGDAWASVGERLGAAAEAALSALAPRWNVAPSTRVPILVRAGDDVQALMARWGFIPAWWKQDKLPQSTINARGEEAAGKPMWRDSFRSARCLIPASHWYEWQAAAGARIPHALAPHDGRGFMFAGLWARWMPENKSVPISSCAILTRAAAPALASVHDRMPVILHPDAWQAWLDPALRDAVAVGALLERYALLEARMWPVSTFVNHPAHEGAECLAPRAAE